MGLSLQLWVVVLATPAVCLALAETNKPTEVRETSAQRFIRHYHLSEPKIQKGERWFCLVLVPSFHGEKAIAMTVRNESVDFEVREFVGPYSHDLGKYPELLKWERRYVRGSDVEMDRLLKAACKPVCHNYVSPLLDGISYYCLWSEVNGDLEMFSAQNPHVEVPESWSDRDLSLNYFQIDGKPPTKSREAEIRGQYRVLLDAWQRIYLHLKEAAGGSSKPDPSKWEEYAKTFKFNDQPQVIEIPDQSR